MKLLVFLLFTFWNAAVHAQPSDSTTSSTGKIRINVTEFEVTNIWPLLRGKSMVPALNIEWKLEPSELLHFAAVLGKIDKNTKKGSPGVTFIQAVAFERAGEPKNAIKRYSTLVHNKNFTTFTQSAKLRIAMLNGLDTTTAAGREKILAIIARDPDGCYFFNKSWYWIQRDDALNSLIHIRSSRLSFEFLSALYAKAPLPRTYSYIFIFLALAIIIKFLELPLFVKTVQMSRAITELAPRVQEINNSTSDPILRSQKIQQLWKEHGIKPMSVCSIVFIDLAYSIWSIFALYSFSPQFALDDATLRWVGDITQFSNIPIILWMFIGTVQQSKQAIQIDQNQRNNFWFITFFGWVILFSVATYWQWPSFVFLYLCCLIILTSVFKTGVSIFQRK